MRSYYEAINTKTDFDKYFDDLLPRILRVKYLNQVAHLFFVWYYVINNAKYFVMSYDGVVFHKYFWKLEYLLFKLNGIKTIVIPYGDDVWMMSKIRDTSRTNSLLISYPHLVAKEKITTKKVFFWAKYADVVLSGFATNNGMPRWDIALLSFLQIDTREWVQKQHYSSNDGRNGEVKIIHTPNHRGCKGTEFLQVAVEELKQEGLLIELILMEKMKNTEVRRMMQEVDILAEQFIATNYALSAIEGLASGLPVLSNLEDESLVKMFRRYSFLNECPVLSTTPETLKNNLRLLITNPKLRYELGILGRQFAEKYHSYKMTKFLFTNIFDKLSGKDVDLINLYHPLLSSYVKNNYIRTPLEKNIYKSKKKLALSES